MFYYICANQRKGWKAADHRNCIPARRAEEWVLDRLRELLESQSVLEAALEQAHSWVEADLGPAREQWSENQKALLQNEAQGEEIVNSITSGNVQGPLWQMLNTKASQLHLQHEQLLMEARRLSELLVPLNENFDAGEITDLLRDFQALAKCAEPQELQRLIRACVRRIEWKTDGNIKMQLYKVGKGYGTKTNSLPAQGASREWLYTDVCNDTSNRHGMKPLF